MKEIEKFLHSKIDDSTFLDYRISFKFNMNIDVFVLSKDEKNSKEENNTVINEFKSQFLNEKIDIDTVTLSDCRMDDFYDYLFSQERNKDKMEMTLKRRDDYLTHYEI
jgi:hypothetical protein